MLDEKELVLQYFLGHKTERSSNSTCCDRAGLNLVAHFRGMYRCVLVLDILCRVGLRRLHDDLFSSLFSAALTASLSCFHW